jgi:hypothetical protein
MPRVVLEPMTPVFDRAKTVHALDSEATVIGGHRNNQINILRLQVSLSSEIGTSSIDWAQLSRFYLKTET